MKQQWKNYLEANGAEFDDNGVVTSFGSPRRELSVALTGNVFADLSDITVIAAHGRDVQSFLQGQFSNDITNVSASRSQLSSYCTPKGRMLANFRLFARDDGVYIALPAALSETFLQRLRMFVLMADVTLEDVSENFIHLGVSGPDAASELEAILGQVPQSVDDALTLDGCTLIRTPGMHPRFEIFGTLECMQKLWEALNVRCAPIGQPAWGLLRVMAGVPMIQPGTSEAFVPQMANMELVNGVNFKKGCYPGQEVVARMQYLGKLKRRMYLGRIAVEPPPEPGTELFSAERPDQGVGRIVEAYPHPDGGCMALAVTQIESMRQGEVRLGAADGPLFEPAELPYELPEVSSG